MFEKPRDPRAEFVEQLKKDRERRELNDKQQFSATKIKAWYRGIKTRRKIKHENLTSFDESFEAFKEFDKSLQLPDAKKAFKLIKLFLKYRPFDNERFSNLCRYLLISNESSTQQANFCVLAFDKNLLPQWIVIMQEILEECLNSIENLRPEMPTEMTNINLKLNLLISFTTSSNWAILKTKTGEPFTNFMQQVCQKLLENLCCKELYLKISNLLRNGLARCKPELKPVPLMACFNLLLRPLQLVVNCNEEYVNAFVVNTMTVPACILHLKNLCPTVVNNITTDKLFDKCIKYLSQSINNLLKILDGNRSLFLLANLINLAFLEPRLAVDENLLNFIQVCSQLMDHCSGFSASKNSPSSHWNVVMGWYSQPLDSGHQDSLHYVIDQLRMLWTGQSVKNLFSCLSDFPDSSKRLSIDRRSSLPSTSNSVQKFFTKVFDKKIHQSTCGTSAGSFSRKFGSPECTMLAMICSLYQKMFTTMKQMKYDILSGLCYQDFLLPRLWHLISGLSCNNGLKAYLELLSQCPKATNPEFQILTLFADCATYLLVILDDMEMYEQQKPFSLDCLKSIAQFANHFVYKSIIDGLIDVKSADGHQLFNAMLGLLTLLHNRDNRRNFCGATEFWQIREIKPSHFLNELDKGNRKCDYLIRKAPHVLPIKDRIVLFRKKVSNDRDSCYLNNRAPTPEERYDRPVTLITVHRTRIVEDGFRELAMLPTVAMKCAVRVTFINEQGLNEPGIDQDGVFKEFLEETVKRVFDPSLNLFRVTSESRLYPSATSHIHDNHLALFEFVGKILAKAVYEGIVADVPLATFVLDHMLGRVNSRIYSSVDMLPSLDPELYKNLTFIKHYDGDVRDLDLTFSIDEDVMGQVVTHELVPGGKSLYVTNENKISYIHSMAHFRLYVQIKNQLARFVAGFRSIIAPDWLALFSAPELLTVICGDADADVPLRDLRQHTQYYGGFHSNHRVILWLWDVLEIEFSAEERRLFLKFVTSCSQPPLLGFAHLVPPFSIRCVEVADDQDEGDTLGSVIRGFLAIRRRDPVGRLPTASTCFNLLKLPNYQKKSTLRDKLRYAIRAGSGFELS